MKIRNSQSGFSIVEVLASMTVFAVAASGLVGTTMSTIKSNSTSRQTTIASALIQQKIEDLRSMDPTTAPADFAAGNHQDPQNPMSVADGVGLYTRSWQVTVNEPEFGLSEVVVTVSWPSANGQRSLRAATLICNSATCS